MSCILYVVNIHGEQDYGRLDFENDGNTIEGVIAKDIQQNKRDSTSGDSDGSDEDSSSSQSYTTTISTYSFSTRKDRESAIYIFRDVHDYVDYDHSKTSDIFYVTHEEYLEEVAKKGFWKWRPPTTKKWTPVPPILAKHLEKCYIIFDPKKDKELYYEHVNISFDFNSMTYVTRSNKSISWEKVWDGKNIGHLKRKCE